MKEKNRWSKTGFSTSFKKIFPNKVTFPNYEGYNNVSDTYKNLFQKLIEVVDNIATLNSVKMKNRSSECVNGKIVEKLV